MSTKSTLARGDIENSHFHFYSEAWDDDHVYLDIRVGNDKNYQYTAVTIPIAVWEVIRQKTIWQGDLVGKTNHQLREEACNFVDKRERDVRDVVRALRKKGMAKKEAEKRGRMMGLIGGAHYGSVEEPYEKQVQQGIASLKQDRTRQTAVWKDISKLRKGNEDCPGVFVLDLKKRKKPTR